MRTVSVIIPTNRLNPWMDQAVLSVLGSEGVSVDLVVVIDGITVESMPTWWEHPRVTVLHHKVSMGPSAAMATGLEHVRSDLVARLDSDDICRSDRLLLQSQALDNNPALVAVSSKTARIDENGEPTGSVRIPASADIREHLLLYNAVPHSTLMFRKSVCERVGGYNKSLRQMEDYDFILRLAAEGPIAQIDSELVSYRVHSQQTSRGAKPTGEHIRIVMNGRRKLAKILGKSYIISEAKNTAWGILQHLRYSGVVRPWHEK